MNKKRLHNLGPYLYILPVLVVVAVFRLAPILLSFTVSFFDWKITGVQQFIGLANYAKVLHDRDFWQSLINTFWMVIFVVPVSLITAMGFALLLNRIKWLKGFFRTTYYIPAVTSLVAVSVVWKMIFLKQSGPANAFLTMFGLPAQGWLEESRGIFDLLMPFDLHSLAAQFAQSTGMDPIITYSLLGGPSLAMVCIIIVCLWHGLGYNTVIYLAGLQNIPQVYYEAARIDGAGAFTSFKKLTLPLVSPTTFYVLLMTTITTFQVFSQVYLMTGPPVGGPLGTTKVIVYYLYELGFGEAQNLSYAGTVALILFCIILALTLLQRRLEKNVHYN